MNGKQLLVIGVLLGAGLLLFAKDSKAETKKDEDGTASSGGGGGSSSLPTAQVVAPTVILTQTKRYPKFPVNVAQLQVQPREVLPRKQITATESTPPAKGTATTA